MSKFVKFTVTPVRIPSMLGILTGVTLAKAGSDEVKW
jgi:hypothetical protein